MKSIIKLLILSAFVCGAMILLDEYSAPVKDPITLSVYGQDQGADPVVPYVFEVNADGTSVLTFSFNRYPGSIIAFSDYIEGGSVTASDVSSTGDYRMRVNPEQNIFVRTPDGVTSFVYLYNEGTGSLIVNGVLRDSWSYGKYERHSGSDPFFSDRSYWAWSSNR